jgi:hypothetical protein
VVEIAPKEAPNEKGVKVDGVGVGRAAFDVGAADMVNEKGGGGAGAGAGITAGTIAGGGIEGAVTGAVAPKENVDNPSVGERERATGLLKSNELFDEEDDGNANVPSAVTGA